MAVKKPVKKKTTARKTTVKKKNNTPYRYIAVIIIFALCIIGIFQMGLIGIGIDSFMAYLFGTPRYLSYVFILLVSLYYGVNNKMIPMNRRLTGWLMLIFSLSAFCGSLFSLNKKGDILPDFNCIFEIESRDGFHFHGGGMLGFGFTSIFSKLLSSYGAILLALILITISVLLIMKRSLRESARIVVTKSVDGTKTAINKTQSELSKRREQKEIDSVKDVSHLSELPKEEIAHEAEDDLDIPIYNSNISQSSFEEQINDEVEVLPVSDEDLNAVRHDNIYDEINEGYETVSHNKPDNLQMEIDHVAIEGESETSEKENPHYQLPPLSLLNAAQKSEKTNMQAVKKKGQLLENTLKNFGVNAKVSQIRIGPAVTQYEVQPAMGVKVNRIVNLHNDIALALAAKDIRIEAPIPGKSAVGIEVPNTSVSMVTLREVLEASPVESNKLKVVLGRDISGEAITAELNKMPHLLVAGATGSGKSVCINGIITSILMNAKPHEVKLMMIDPKMVELNVYNGIPHLLTPVVTNPQKAAQALQKIVGEMEHRYDLFSHSGTRNIEGYNAYLTRQNDELGEKNALLPYIVVIVDELADLMMVASKDVEAAIMRIAQMARAAGIHLIIATQRPSVDVITGLIKANIPSRIAFSVSSQIDSRTILDGQGAEKLLGKGDMLYLPSGQSKPTRVQGAFLSDSEVEAVVNFVTKQQSANYIKTLEPDAIPEGQVSESEDELYGEAKLFVIEKQKASASLLQRQFRIGYNRAARLVDELEANGVIGPSTGSKPRQVLIQEEDLGG